MNMSSSLTTSQDTIQGEEAENRKRKALQEVDSENDHKRLRRGNSGLKRSLTKSLSVGGMPLLLELFLRIMTKFLSSCPVRRKKTNMSDMDEFPDAEDYGDYEYGEDEEAEYLPDDVDGEENTDEPVLASDAIKEVLSIPLFSVFTTFSHCRQRPWTFMSNEGFVKELLQTVNENLGAYVQGEDEETVSWKCLHLLRAIG